MNFLDLGDTSQPDNGAHLSGGDVDITDSESEISMKEDDVDDDPLETLYVSNDEEEFGDVRHMLVANLKAGLELPEIFGTVQNMKSFQQSEDCLDKLSIIRTFGFAVNIFINYFFLLSCSMQHNL